MENTYYDEFDNEPSRMGMKKGAQIREDSLPDQERKIDEKQARYDAKDELLGRKRAARVAYAEKMRRNALRSETATMESESEDEEDAIVYEGEEEIDPAQEAERRKAYEEWLKSQYPEEESGEESEA